MSKPIVASVQRFEEPSGDGPSGVNLLTPGARARVSLEGNTYLIDPEDPSYTGWTRILRSRERSGKPVYVETESAGEAGERITRIEVPRLRQVAEIFPIPEREGFGVSLAGSPLLLYVPFERSEALQSLRAAQEQGQEVLITSDAETEEVLDVRPFAVPEERAALLAGLVFPPFPGQLTDVLSIRQVLDEFEFLVSQADIPFDFPRDCCTARAHAMFGLLRSRGFRCRKIWNYGGGGVAALSKLRFFTLLARKGFVTWRLHVAPLVNVRLGNGHVVPMVLDPAMFSRPVRVAEWVALQHDSSAVQQISDPELLEREVHGAKPRSDDNFGTTRDWLDDHIAIRNRNPFPPP